MGRPARLITFIIFKSAKKKPKRQNSLFFQVNTLA